MKEKTYFSRGHIVVTSSRIVFGDKTYATKDVSSVQTSVIRPNRTWPIIVLIAGIISLLAGIGFIVAGTFTPYIVIGVPAVLGATAALCLRKPSFVVRLTASSGNTRSLSFKDREETIIIADAITKAITR